METAATRPTTAADRFDLINEAQAETRHDPVTGRWTIFAPHRGERPDEFAELESGCVPSADCPFCHGNEGSTPPAVWSATSADDWNGRSGRIPPDPATHRTVGDFDSWSVRVVPNKFPAVAPVPRTRRRSLAVGSAIAGDAGGISHTPLFQSRPLWGGHEVIIESPVHVQSLSELDAAQVGLVFAAYRDRIRFWRETAKVRYISVFKNVGRDAGASLQHGHGQLIAINSLPSDVASIAERSQRYRAATGCCLHCDLIRGELREQERIVFQSPQLVAYCPFSSALPYLVRITTKEHQACFEDLAWPVLYEVAQLTRRVVRWLERLFPGIAYNYLLHTRPPRIGGDGDAHHWSLEIFPRVTRMAGFEYSSQCMINPVLPETAARALRSCASQENPRQAPSAGL